MLRHPPPPVVVARGADPERHPVVETSATITWVHHNAGLNGQSGSSKIDAVNLRDRDTTDNGTLDERRYYTQNFKGDVVVTLKDGDFDLEYKTMAPIAGTFVWSSV